MFEAGIAEWIKSVISKYPKWKIHISPHLQDSEYEASDALLQLGGQSKHNFIEDLHLSVSMRSFRAEKLSGLVKQILDLETQEAQSII